MNDINWTTLSQFGSNVIPDRLSFINDLNSKFGQQPDANNPYGSVLQSFGSNAQQLYGKGMDVTNPQKAFTSYEGQRGGIDMGYAGFNPEQNYMRQIGKFNTVANYGGMQ